LPTLLSAQVTTPCQAITITITITKTITATTAMEELEEEHHHRRLSIYQQQFDPLADFTAHT